MFFDVSLLVLLFLSLILVFLFLLIYCRHYTIKKSNKKDDYIAMLVHDIRSPLSVIKGSADILIHDDSNLSKQQKIDLLKQVQITSDSLLLLVNDILDASKMQSGKYEIFKSSTDLNSLVKLVTDSFIVLAKENKVKLEVDLESQIPKVNADQEKIKRVLTNLISNALKYTPEDGVIKVSTSFLDDLIYVKVSDTGIGIDDKTKKKLFDKFVQGSKTIKSSYSSSSGLGLSVSKQIINLHNGKIWIEDNNPKGSVFIFTLPSMLPEF